MGLWTKFNDMRLRLAETVGGFNLQHSIEQQIKVKKEALLESLGLPNIEAGIDPDEHLFRSISRRARRDIQPFKRERQLKIVYWLYLAYPVAKRGMDLTVDFTVGEGLSYTAKDEKVKEVLDDFWKDPINRWDLKQFTRVLELGLFGELIMPVKVNPMNGKVRMSYIDPLEVERVDTLPNNVEIPVHVVLKGGNRHSIEHVSGPGAGHDHDFPKSAEEKARTLNVIRPDEDINSKTHDKLVGDTFFFAINKVSNATRGSSDLFCVIDWLELHEQFLMGIHEAADAKSSVVWDVTVEGADPKTLERFKREFGRITKGMTRFHNEKVKIDPKAPELGTTDLEAHASVLKRHIATGLGLPEHWLSDPGGANRATAAEMGVPTTRRLRSRQKFVVNMMEYIFDFVLDQAIIAGRLPEDVDRTFAVMAPQVWPIDTQRITTSLVTAAQALMLAEQQGWIDQKSAADTFKLIADQLGVKLAPLEEIGRVDNAANANDRNKNKMLSEEEIENDILSQVNKALNNGKTGRPIGPTPANLQQPGSTPNQTGV